MQLQGFPIDCQTFVWARHAVNISIKQALVHNRKRNRGVSWEAHTLYHSGVVRLDFRQSACGFCRCGDSQYSFIYIRFPTCEARGQLSMSTCMLHTFYHTSNSHIFYYKSRENLYQVLQVTCVRLNVQWSRRFMWQNHYHHSTKLYRGKYHSLLLLAVHL